MRDYGDGDRSYPTALSVMIVFQQTLLTHKAPRYIAADDIINSFLLIFQRK